MSLCLAAETMDRDTGSQNDSARRMPFGTFETLPKETRNMIHMPVLSKRQHVFDKDFKSLYTDTKEMLHRHGVYRVHLEGTYLIT